MQGKCYMYCACLVAYLVSSLVHHQYQYQLSAIQHRYIQVSSFCRSFYHNQCTPCLLHASCSPCLAPPVLSNQILKHQVQMFSSYVTCTALVPSCTCIRAVILVKFSPSVPMDLDCSKETMKLSALHVHVSTPSLGVTICPDHTFIVKQKMPLQRAQGKDDDLDGV